MEPELLFWTKVAAVGQVLGALATAGAVIVSLWVVLSERRVRVKVTAGLRLLIVQGQPAQAEEVISITVVNVGHRPVNVASIGWRYGWTGRFGPKWSRIGYAIQTSARRADSQDPPYLLEPGQQKLMLINLAPFHGEDSKAQRTARTFTAHVPLFGRLPANIRCAAHVIGARSRYFRVEKPLAQFFATGKTSGALERLKAGKQSAS